MPDSAVTRSTRGLVFALFLSVVGCSDGAAPSGGVPAASPRGTDQLRPAYDEGGRLQKLEYDRDGNGKMDTWGYMDGPRVVRVEVDTNGDGQVDVWEHHRADAPALAARDGAAGPDTTVDRVERATRFDGRVSRTEYFDAGLLARVEEDTNGDGRVDTWETYEAGALRTLAVDRTGRGTPDERVTYGSGGAITRVERDTDDRATFQGQQP